MDTYKIIFKYLSQTATDRLSRYARPHGKDQSDAIKHQCTIRTIAVLPTTRLRTKSSHTHRDIYVYATKFSIYRVGHAFFANAIFWNKEKLSRTSCRNATTNKMSEMTSNYFSSQSVTEAPPISDVRNGVKLLNPRDRKTKINYPQVNAHPTVGYDPAFWRRHPDNN